MPWSGENITIIAVLRIPRHQWTLWPSVSNEISHARGRIQIRQKPCFQNELLWSKKNFFANNVLTFLLPYWKKLNIEAYNSWNTEYFIFLILKNMYVSWKARKPAFLFPPGILEGSTDIKISKKQKFSFLPKNGFGIFCLVTIMVPTSLQDAGMKRKSRFSGFSANVDVV